MRFLPIAYLSLGMDTVISTAEFKAIFDRVKLKDDDFTPDKFKPGSSGQTLLYKEILLASKLDDEFLGRVQARSPDHARWRFARARVRRPVVRNLHEMPPAIRITSFKETVGVELLRRKPFTLKSLHSERATFRISRFSTLKPSSAI
jgi:hypothetical protein